MAPKLMIIGERSYCSSFEIWIQQLQRIERCLSSHPEVSLQIRSKTSTAKQDIRRAIEIIPTSDQIILNGVWPDHSYPQHIPEQDLSRTLTGDFGASIHSPKALYHAIRCGAQYVQFGSIFSTNSKPVSPRGIDALKEIVSFSSVPVLAVGGITEHNVNRCLDAGCHGVSVGSWILGATEENKLEERLKRLLMKMY